MTDLERARKAADLVATMVSAWRELTDEYWHDMTPTPYVERLNQDLAKAEWIAARDLKHAEQSTIQTNIPGKTTEED